MVYLVNPAHITTGKSSYKVLQAQGRKTIAPPPSKPKMSKEKMKEIEGSGFDELTNKLSNIKLKDICKNIKITM